MLFGEIIAYCCDHDRKHKTSFLVNRIFYYVEEGVVFTCSN
jgi:hypothetical protein